MQAVVVAAAGLITRETAVLAVLAAAEQGLARKMWQAPQEQRTREAAAAAQMPTALPAQAGRAAQVSS